MKLTAEQLTRITGGKPNVSNLNSVIVSLDRHGAKNGLDKPHRLAHYIAQLTHENGNFKYDEEIASGAAYEGRKDLGNTHPGDGKKFKGRTGIQITGRANYAAFRDWCRKTMGLSDVPDFEEDPAAINTDPWEGLAPIWFWSTRKLNALADSNDLEQITKKINGGLNGYSDRIAKYVRAALVLLGYSPTDVLEFQKQAQAEGLLPKGVDQLDGDAGPKTRAAMHMMLAGMSVVKAEAPVTPAPVVTEKVVDVKAPTNAGADAATGAGVGAAGLGGVLQTLQEQLTPFSMAGGWIGKLVVILIIVGGLLTVGGLLWRWWNKRRKAEMLETLNA